MAKKKFINQTYIEGYLYEHKLEAKTAGSTSKTPGVNYIRGSISIATNEDCTNIVTVYYPYETPTKADGGANSTYSTLLNIIEGKYGNYMKDGKEGAVKLKVNSAIGINDFYIDRNGKEELISAKRNERGFIHLLNAFETENEKDRATFKNDIIITTVTHVEEDVDNKRPEKAIIKGLTFDYRGALIPVEFSAVNSGAISYFESLEASQSNPVFTKVWGEQVSEVIIRSITEESAFGEASVREVKNSRKDFVITGAAKETYPWDDESSITVAEFKQKLADREVYLATVKKNNDEYKANKNAPPFDVTPNVVTNTTSGFNF